MNQFVKEVDAVPLSAANDGDRPDIQIRAGERDRLVVEAEVALRRAGRVFQIGGHPTVVGYEEMPTLDGDRKLLRRVLLTKATMVTELARAARWLGADRKGKLILKEPPSGVAAHLLEQRVDLRLPVLSGIITAPQLRPDGAIIAPGYDAVSGLYFDPCGVDFPEVPKRPSQDQARTALERLAQPLRNFAFVDNASRAVALGSLLTPFVRRSFSTAPGFGYSSPVRGSGKTKLAKASALLATGESSAAISTGSGHEELEKRIGAILLSGRPYVTLDNIEGDKWNAPLLCMALTEDAVEIRVLGTSTSIEARNVTTIAATGNNLVIPGDLTRRFLLCRLDPGVEQPEFLQFDFDPCDEVLRNRPQLACDALTVLRAHLEAGQPQQEGLVPLGSFEGWCRFVRDALVWLGEADPVASMNEVRKDDPERATLDAVMQAWERLGPGGAGRQSASGLVGLTKSNPEWHAALFAVAARKDALCAIRLGHWISKHKDRVVNGRRIRKAGTTNGVSMYQLEAALTEKGRSRD